MRSRDRLLLRLWVGVGVVHDHRVRRLQVEPPPRRLDAQQEDKDARVWRVELVDGRLTLLQRGGAVDAQRRARAEAPRHVVLEDVQHFGHGAEEQHAVARQVQLDQHAVERVKLAAGDHRGGARHAAVRRGGQRAHVAAGGRQPGVVANLAQLHAAVLEGLPVVAARASCTAGQLAGRQGVNARGRGPLDPLVDVGLSAAWAAVHHV